MDINPAAASMNGPRGKAHGVVAKLGTGHFNPVAEARLMAHFGHHLKESQPGEQTDKPSEADTSSNTDVSQTDNAALHDAPLHTHDAVVDTYKGSQPTRDAQPDSRDTLHDVLNDKTEEPVGMYDASAALNAESVHAQTRRDLIAEHTRESFKAMRVDVHNLTSPRISFLS